jgi:hypothetical protein
VVKVTFLVTAGMTIPVNISLHGSVRHAKDRDPNSPFHAAPDSVNDDAFLREVARRRLVAAVSIGKLKQNAVGRSESLC